MNAAKDGRSGDRLITHWAAALSSGQEVPKQVVKTPAARGLFKATLTGATLKWTLTFAKLSGTATAAHIHTGGKGVPGPVLIALCGPCTSGAKGTAILTQGAISAMG